MTIRWEIDWDDDNYASSYANVTERIIDAELRLGTDLSLATTELPATLPYGVLMINPLDDALDPASDTGVPSGVLLSGHAARMTVGTYVWNGRVRWRGQTGNVNAKLLVWELVHAEQEAAEDTHTLASYADSDLASVAGQLAEQLGLVIENVPAVPTGVILQRATGLALLVAVSQFAGSIAFDSGNGWKMVRWEHVGNAVSAVTLDTDHGMLPDARTTRHNGLVYNGVILQASALAASVSTDIASQDVRIRSGSVRDIVLDVPLRLGLVTATGASSDNTNVTILNQPELSGRQVRLRIGATAMAVPQNENATITVQGTSRPVETVAERRLVAAGTAGSPELKMPAWFPSDFSGISQYALRNLRARSEPPTSITVDVPLKQTTTALLEEVTQAATLGTGVTIDHPTIGTAMSGVSVAAKFTGGRDKQDRLELTLLDAPAMAALGLSVEVTGIGDTDIATLVYIEAPDAAATLYVRHREVADPESAWTAGTSQTADIELLDSHISALTAATDYEAEWSLASDYSNAQRVAFRTAAASPAPQISLIEFQGSNLGSAWTELPGNVFRAIAVETQTFASPISADVSFRTIAQIGISTNQGITGRIRITPEADGIGVQISRYWITNAGAIGQSNNASETYSGTAIVSGDSNTFANRPAANMPEVRFLWRVTLTQTGKPDGVYWLAMKVARDDEAPPPYPAPAPDLSDDERFGMLFMPDPLDPRLWIPRPGVPLPN